MVEVILTAENTDIWMDEQTSMQVTVNTVLEDGVTPRDITGGTVTWKAFLNGVEKIKMDTPTMLIMLAPITETTLTGTATAGTSAVTLTKVAGFGADSWGRPIADFAVGDIVILTSAGGLLEYATITQINGTTLSLTSPLTNSYAAADTCQKIISQFTFQLLPGHTILPVTKSYGTPIIYDHMALVTFPAGLSPGDIYQQPTSVVAVRGRIFIKPIFDMS